MNSDIYKKGLILVAIIVVALITVLGYIIDNSNNNEITPKDSTIVEDDCTEDNEEIISTIIVDINGAVKNPGIYELEDGSRLDDAIKAAGDFSDDVNCDYVAKYINKARTIRDGEKIYIPKLTDNIEDMETNTYAAEGLYGGKININTASKNQLIGLNGIGESFAQRIIDYRQSNRFTKIEDIKNVKGIGDKTFEQIKDYITVE